MLRLEGVRLRQGDFTLSLDAQVPRGARVSLMGASGSGKSTLLALVAGFVRADAGRVLIAGEDVSRRPVAARPLSILFQDGNLFPHLSVFDNVALGVAPSLRLGQEDRARVTASLARVGLDGFGARYPRALSGGQQSRVALARMLLQGRPLALLDEPFAALDPGLRSEMLALLRDLCADIGLTLVMATHDLRDAERLCDRVLLLEAGRLGLDAPLAQARAAEALRPWC